MIVYQNGLTLRSGSNLHYLNFGSPNYPDFDNKITKLHRTTPTTERAPNYINHTKHITLYQHSIRQEPQTPHQREWGSLSNPLQPKIQCREPFL